MPTGSSSTPARTPGPSQRYRAENKPGTAAGGSIRSGVNISTGDVGLLQKLGMADMEFDFSSLMLTDSPKRPQQPRRIPAVTGQVKVEPTVLAPTKRIPIKEPQTPRVKVERNISVRPQPTKPLTVKEATGPIIIAHHDPPINDDIKPSREKDIEVEIKLEKQVSPPRPAVSKKVVYELPDKPPPFKTPLVDIPARGIVDTTLRSRTSPLDSDNSDTEWITRQRTPARRRVIVESDSDSEFGVNTRLKAREDYGGTESPGAGPLISRSRGVVREDSAGEEDEERGDQEDDHEEEGDRSEGEEEEGIYNIAKHYDSSYGSLRDFIVDDSEEESTYDSATPSPPPKVKLRKLKPATASPIASDSDESVPGPSRHAPPTSNILDSEDESDGILAYSPPPKLSVLPNITDLTLSDSEPEVELPPTKRPTKAVKSTPSTRPSKKDWQVERARIADGIFTELNRKVFESKLSGAKMVWNNRLLKTAGMARSTRKKQADGSKIEELSIVLSEKVLTGKEQILSTVAHEMCHLATWVISNERKNPHGAIFKGWGRKVMRARPDIEVTTTHSYTIEYKYEWKCTSKGCEKIYRRHSKSIDIKKDACGGCKGRLEPLFATKAGTPFQAYLKANMAHAKLALPKQPHGEVMRALSRQWNDAGPEYDHASHWRAVARAAAPQ